jgi:hypothetical protein
MGKARNIFIVGLTDFQRRALQSLSQRGRYRFHSLLTYYEAVEEKAAFDDLLTRARRQLLAFDGSIDAIISHWDFPTSCLVPVLCADYGIPAPSLESVLKCEHKYWARIEQSKVVPEAVPRFAAVDPFDPAAADKITLDYPFWLKPVKGFSSMLGFPIDDRTQFEAALAQIRPRIGELGHAFNQALARVELPPEVAGVGGLHCIAEEIITGAQAAPEGYVFNGEFHVHGMLDMIRDINGKSFARLQYPSALPATVQQRMIGISRKVLHQVGFDNSCFNAEFMWDAAQDKVWLIEVNTRMSQSHSELFLKVDGVSNHAIAIDLALGERPRFAHRQGPYRMAAKFWINKFGDADVTRVPSAREIRAAERSIPGDPRIDIAVQPGGRLSELVNQDPYRYVLGEAYLGGSCEEELLENYRQCIEQLPFGFTDPPHGERRFSA